jgi:hypothetical protein
MRSNDIDNMQHPSGPVVRLGADHHHLRKDREVSYCTCPLAEIAAGPHATVHLHPALLFLTSEEVPRA